MTFKDHFSNDSNEYARYRPSYPDELLEYLASLAPARDAAWDCATGSGQAAVGLARRFTRVLATDASQAQIDGATPHPRVSYRVARAESSGLADRSVDLVTVAQALHWFDFVSFYRETRRVLKDGGVLAVWSYDLMSVSPEIDRLIEELYHRTLAAHWPPERRYVSDRYASLPFPLVESGTPAFDMIAEWTLDEIVGYLGTWSAVNRYEAEKRIDPVAAITPDLTVAWGESERKRVVRWPLGLRVGRFARAD